MRRLFSTFAPGWPGAGLLILRLVACSASVADGLGAWKAEQPVQSVVLSGGAILAGALLAVGLWTPVCGCLVAALASWAFLTQSAGIWDSILLAAIGIALAMIGPGVCSVDARLFGWRRIPIGNR